MSNYKETTLREMCDTCSDMLKPGERRAALKFMARVVDDPTWTRTAEELLYASPSLTINKAYSQAQKQLTPTAPTAAEEPEEQEFFHEQEDDTQLMFVDEPPADEIRIVGVWERIARTLSAHRGRWALVQTCPSRGRCKQIERDINRGRYHGMRPEGAYEARAVTVHGEHRLYARAV